jgi:hypothetical protein
MATTLTRKPLPLTAWHLTDQAAMLEALGALSEQGWRGSLAPTNGMWKLEVNADNPTRQISAETGDWLVLDWDLRKLSDDDCTANYDGVV